MSPPETSSWLQPSGGIGRSGCATICRALERALGGRNAHDGHSAAAAGGATSPRLRLNDDQLFERYAVSRGHAASASGGAEGIGDEREHDRRPRPGASRPSSSRAASGSNTLVMTFNAFAGFVLKLSTARVSCLSRADFLSALAQRLQV